MTDSAYHKMQTEIMPAPVGCPVNREFSTFEEHYMQDPYAELIGCGTSHRSFILRNSAISF